MHTGSIADDALTVASAFYIALRKHGIGRWMDSHQLWDAATLELRRRDPYAGHPKNPATWLANVREELRKPGSKLRLESHQTGYGRWEYRLVRISMYKKAEQLALEV